MVLDRITRLEGRLRSYATLTADLALAERKVRAKSQAEIRQL